MPARTQRRFTWRGGAAAYFLCGVTVAGVALNAGAPSASASSGVADAFTLNTARTVTFRALTGWTPRKSAAKSHSLAVPSGFAVTNGTMNPMTAISWKNTSGNTDYNAGASWTGGVAPGASDVATFTGAAVSQPSLSANITNQGLNFSTAATSGYTLSSTGGFTLTLTNVGTGASAAINAANTNTISAALKLGGAEEWQAASARRLPTPAPCADEHTACYRAGSAGRCCFP